MVRAEQLSAMSSATRMTQQSTRQSQRRRDALRSACSPVGTGSYLTVGAAAAAVSTRRRMLAPRLMLQVALHLTASTRRRSASGKHHNAAVCA